MFDGVPWELHTTNEEEKRYLWITRNTMISSTFINDINELAIAKFVFQMIS